jgi:RNA polymerase sigma factor (sigma-70 family)
MPSSVEDMIGDCHIVLLQVVAAFNPWMEVRFSTYAYTCLVRALARKSRRSAADRLVQAMSLDTLQDAVPIESCDLSPLVSSASLNIEELLRADHPLMSAREKTVISRRFALHEGDVDPTLEAVGRVVGLSKERVRQVQAVAVEKLRTALLPATR